MIGCNEGVPSFQTVYAEAEFRQKGIWWELERGIDIWGMDDACGLNTNRKCAQA